MNTNEVFPQLRETLTLGIELMDDGDDREQDFLDCISGMRKHIVSCAVDRELLRDLLDALDYAELVLQKAGFHKKSLEAIQQRAIVAKALEERDAASSVN